jgi:hypothetical protein
MLRLLLVDSPLQYAVLALSCIEAIRRFPQDDRHTRIGSARVFDDIVERRCAA